MTFPNQFPSPGNAPGRQTPVMSALNRYASGSGCNGCGCRPSASGSSNSFCGGQNVSPLPTVAQPTAYTLGHIVPPPLCPS
jgi:hypothetical protein